MINPLAFTTNPEGCGAIDNYDEFLETTIVGSTGLNLETDGCIANPCRILVNNSAIRLSVNPFEFSFRISAQIETDGAGTQVYKNISGVQIQVICSELVQISYNGTEYFELCKTITGGGGISEKIINQNLFATDDNTNCGIEEISFVETTQNKTINSIYYPLSQLAEFYANKCPDPTQFLHNDGCRKVYIPTELYRNDLPTSRFTFDFTVIAKGGAKLVKTLGYYVECSNQVIIQAPIPLQTGQLLVKTWMTGDLLFTLNPFTTDDQFCPINKYWVSSGTNDQVVAGCSSQTSGDSEACRQVTIKSQILGSYSVTFSVKAKGETIDSTTASFIFNIVCGFLIKELPEPQVNYDPAANPIILLYKKGSSGIFVFGEYKFNGGSCEIQQYYIDNDDDISTPYEPIDGILGFQQAIKPCNSAAGQGCRTLLFETNAQQNYAFWIHVLGEGPEASADFKTSPQIIIKVGCNSQSFSPSLTQNVPFHHFVSTPGSTQLFQISTFSPNAPDFDCAIISYNLNQLDSGQKVKQLKENCADSLDCQTAVIDTSSPGLFEFTFTIISNGILEFNTITTFNYTANVTCGNETQLLSAQSRAFVFYLDQFNNSINFKYDGISNLFQSSISACPITSFAIFDYRYPSLSLTGSKIKLLKPDIIDQTSMEIITSYSYVSQIYLYSYVNDKRAEKDLQIEITVCGLEQLNSTQSQVLRFYAKQTEKDLNKVVLTTQQISRLFEFKAGLSSNNCDNEKVWLYEDQELSKSYVEPQADERSIGFKQHIEDDGAVVQEVILHTTMLLDETTLYLGRITKGKVKAYIELSFKVTDSKTDPGGIEIVNHAPTFIETLKSKFEFQIDDQIPEEYKHQKVRYETQIPLIEDDNQELAEVKIISKTLGTVKWNNSSQEMHENPDQILQFDFESRLILFEFKNYESLAKTNGSHQIQITLKDSHQKQSNYSVEIIFKIKPGIVNYDQKNESILEKRTSLSSNLTAQIIGLNKFGELTIEFNKNMQTDLNITQFSSSNSYLNRSLEYFSNLMTMYVIPNNDWNEYTSGFEIQQVNFTWHTKKFQGRMLHFDLVFNNESYISPNEVQDTLVVWINENKTFFQQVEAPFDYLNTNCTIMKTRIPKQVKNTQLQRSIDEATHSAQTSIIITLVYQLLIQTGGSLIFIVSMINALQFIFHLPIMNIIFPANVMSYFSLMIPIVMFDLLSDISYFEDKFKALDDDASDIRDQMRDLGYDTHNPFLILKTLLAFQILYFVRLGFLFGVVYPLQKYCKHTLWKIKLKTVYKQMLKQLVFKEIITIFFGSLFELLLAGTLQMKAPENNKNQKFIYTFFSYYLMAIPVVIIPAIFFWVFTKNLKQINSSKFQNRWGILTDGLNMKNPLQVTYYLVFCFRRVYFVSLSLIFTQYPVMQIIGLNLMNLLILIYITNIQPFIGRFRNRLEIFNDFSMICTTLMMMLFTDWVIYPTSQSYYGYRMIIFISAFISFNMCFVLWETLKTANLIRIKHFKRFRRWQENSIQKNYGQYLKRVVKIKEETYMLEKNRKENTKSGKDNKNSQINKYSNQIVKIHFARERLSAEFQNTLISEIPKPVIHPLKILNHEIEEPTFQKFIILKTQNQSSESSSHEQINQRKDKIPFTANTRSDNAVSNLPYVPKSQRLKRFRKYNQTQNEEDFSQVNFQRMTPSMIMMEYQDQADNLNLKK